MKINKKVVFIILGVLVLISVLSGATYFGYKTYQVSILKKETNKIGSMDIMKDHVDSKIYTSGKYRVVEKTMKKYIDDYATVSKKVLSLLSDEKLKNLLTVSTIKEDGKEFPNTISYLNQKKADLETTMNQMITMTSDKEIMKAIESTKVDVYYQNLYRELMLDSSISDALKQEQNHLIDTKNDTIEFIDHYIAIFEFLKENAYNYTVTEDQILFNSESLYQQYQCHLENLKK